MDEKINIVLVGNSNTGKTTLFNALSSSNEHVGNWHGVTIAIKEKEIIYNSTCYNIVDLPGAYSLNPLSLEEKVTVDYIFSNPTSIYVVVCTEDTIIRNLYFALLLLELNYNVCLALNIFRKDCDENKKIEKIVKNRLKTPIFSQNFNKKINFQHFFNEISKINQTKIELNYLKNFPINKLNAIFFREQQYNSRFFSMRQLEGNLNLDTLKNLTQIDKDFLSKIKTYYQSEIISSRYNYLTSLFSISVKNKTSVNIIDKIVLNKVFAIPIFLAIMLTIFYLTFSSFGAFLSSGLEYIVAEKIGGYFTGLFADTPLLWLKSFILDCLIGGVGSVLVFLPQVVLLFFFLNILEQCGYLTRVAYVFQGLFEKIGLEGKSVFTLLLGFGCSATALLTANNLSSQKSKIKTVLTTPFIPCSAKLPVMVVLVSAFFKKEVLIIFLFYLLACAFSLIWAKILSLGDKKRKKDFVFLEFTKYVNPFNKQLLFSILESVKNFLIRVGSYIFAFSIVIWFLQSFDFSLHYVGVENYTSSILHSISTFLSPIFSPIGLGNWGLVSALISGLIAKELIVSTIGIINGVSGGQTQISTSLLLSSSIISLSLPQVLSLLTFIAFYPPCIATFSSMRASIGIKHTLFGYISMLLIAYTFSYIIYSFASIFQLYGLKIGIIVAISLVVIFAIIIYIFNSSNRCGYDCRQCDKKCNKMTQIKTKN